MSTNSCIIVKVRKGDIGTKKSFNTNTLGEVEEAKWSDGPYGEDCKDRARPVKIGSDYIAIYCHWDGFPSSVGAALKNAHKKVSVMKKRYCLFPGVRIGV